MIGNTKSCDVFGLRCLDVCDNISPAHVVTRANTIHTRTVAELREVTGLGDKAALIGDDVHAVLTLEGSVAARNHIGGTAPAQVRAAIAAARATL